MRTFQILEPVFKTEPFFIVDCSHAEMATYLKKRFRVTVDPCPDGIIGSMLTLNGAPWRVVWVARARLQDLPHMVHELLHLVTRICADKGVPIVAHHPTGENGDETAAYLLEFFVERVWRKLRR